jgi:hypothetical protein
VLGHERLNFRKLKPTFSAAAKAEWRTHQGLCATFIIGDLGGWRSAIEAIQQRFGVQQVDVAGPAMHIKLDDCAGGGGEVGRWAVRVGCSTCVAQQ